MKTKKKTVIVNADDYGVDFLRSLGIFIAAASGAINSISVLIVNLCPLERKMLVFLQKHLKIRIGLHVDITSKDLLTISGLAHLTNGQQYNDKRDVWRALLSDEVDYDLIESEIEAQIKKFQDDLGFTPDFIDSHNHVHIANLNIYSIFKRLADAYRMSFLRVPSDRMLSLRSKRSRETTAKKLDNANLNVLCGLVKHMRYSRAADITLYDLCIKRLTEQLGGNLMPSGYNFYGTDYGHAGKLADLASIFKEIARNPILDSTHEIMVHPGLNPITQKGNPFSNGRRLVELAHVLLLRKHLQKVTEAGVADLRKDN